MGVLKTRNLVLLLFILIIAVSCSKQKPFEPDLSDDIILNEDEMLNLKQNTNIINKFGAFVYPNVIRMDWEKSDEGTELGYLIYKRKRGEANWTGPLTGSKVITTAYNDYDIKINEEYQYKIVCYNSTDSYVLDETPDYYVKPMSTPASASIVINGDSTDWANIPVVYVTKPFYNYNNSKITWNPAALYNLSLFSDESYLYIGFTVFENDWGDDVEYWVAIESINLPSDASASLPANWGHSGTSFSGWNPNFVCVIKNVKYKGGIQEVWESHWDENSASFTSQTQYFDWKASLSQRWFEMRISLYDLLYASVGDAIKIVLWTSQQNKAGAHWSIPVNDSLNPYGDSNTSFDNYIEYVIGSGIN